MIKVNMRTPRSGTAIQPKAGDYYLRNGELFELGSGLKLIQPINGEADVFQLDKNVVIGLDRAGLSINAEDGVILYAKKLLGAVCARKKIIQHNRFASIKSLSSFQDIHSDALRVEGFLTTLSDIFQTNRQAHIQGVNSLFNNATVMAQRVDSCLSAGNNLFQLNPRATIGKNHQGISLISDDGDIFAFGRHFEGRVSAPNGNIFIYGKGRFEGELSAKNIYLINARNPSSYKVKEGNIIRPEAYELESILKRSGYLPNDYIASP